MTDQVGGHVRAAVIGCGFGGLGAAVRLRREGVRDLLVLEAAGSLGGTWRENTYPGAACDIPSHLYSYSFAPNPHWPRAFAAQPDILAYLERVADTFGVRPHLRLHTTVTAARWQPERARWHLTTNRGELTADLLVTAAGMHSAPKIPDIPGLDTFPGTHFHSACWDHDQDLTGRRVAVVGTGASATQIVPALQPAVRQVLLFQRHAPWVLPKFDRPYPRAERRLYDRLPALRLLQRGRFWAVGEVRSDLLTRRLRQLTLAEKLVAGHLRLAVRDPDLRRKLRPDYRMGCKRVTFSNTFYPALGKENVELIASGLARVEGSTLIGQDGSRHEADTIVFATGFHNVGRPITRRIAAADGTTLAEAWDKTGGIRALRGTTMDGFPNLLMMGGPQAVSSSSSKVLMIEAQLDYLGDYVRHLDRLGGPGGGVALDPEPGAVRAWNATMRRKLTRTVWETGCDSPYLDHEGRDVTHWPGTTTAFRRATRQVDLGEYRVVRAVRETAA
ncbi:flavin-containing monooxygenase [Streptomyces ginkgonis]|uniref:flavin-containing monooxygenase n=1 Tax=Streptomyces ginkgonis TaxID=1812259 RepID=UPI0021769C92|nr:NAD(P)/FAD-dependent oxidoreductase [Streptomyces ginkgonis]